MDALVYDELTKKDGALLSYFSWAGSNFPFHSNAADITISGPTTWSDAVGYKKVGKLTINAGQTLTIRKSPFFIFADEIAFGDTASTIDASGPSGGAGPVTFPSAYNMANGATYDTIAQGGCGGGMLFVLCNRITGANGVIKANGGDGFRVTTNSSISGGGGQGALSTLVDSTSASGEVFHFMLGASNYQADLTTDTFLKSLTKLLGDGGHSTSNDYGIGGGSGGKGSNGGGGGSGIGGGGSCVSSGTSSNGSLPVRTLTPSDLLALAGLKCLGGGGGGVDTSTDGTKNGAAGGGAGSVVVWTHAAIATPTLQANGGAGVGGWAGTCHGAAGVTYLIVL